MSIIILRPICHHADMPNECDSSFFLCFPWNNFSPKCHLFFLSHATSHACSSEIYAYKRFDIFRWVDKLTGTMRICWQLAQAHSYHMSFLFRVSYDYLNLGTWREGDGNQTGSHPPTDMGMGQKNSGAASWSYLQAHMYAAHMCVSVTHATQQQTTACIKRKGPSNNYVPQHIWPMYLFHLFLVF